MPHSTIKHNRNIIECCNNTHQGAPRTGKQTSAFASDLGNASHVTCEILCRADPRTNGQSETSCLHQDWCADAYKMYIHLNSVDFCVVTVLQRSSAFLQTTFYIEEYGNVVCMPQLLWLVHTEDADETKLFCLVRVGGVNTIGDQTKLSCLVCNCVHTANATRQEKTVFRVSNLVQL